MHMTAVKPAESAIIVARIGESTEKQPFTAQAQGMIGGLSFCRRAMPKGRGMPMQKPSGKKNEKHGNDLARERLSREQPGHERQRDNGDNAEAGHDEQDRGPSQNVPLLAHKAPCARADQKRANDRTGCVGRVLQDQDHFLDQYGLYEQEAESDGRKIGKRGKRHRRGASLH